MQKEEKTNNIQIVYKYCMLTNEFKNILIICLLLLFIFN